MIGQTISHYRITSKLGEGGMGEVYLAEDTKLDRKVALKFLPQEMQRDESARKRFLREAKSAAALDHPFICKIYETGQAQGKDFISMEYVQGNTLRDELTEAPLALKEALRQAVEIAEALETAHGQEIVHRDLKPSNIMIMPDGHAKVTDFGLAKRLTPLHEVGGQEKTLTASMTKTGTTVGTLAYMSPEQLRGEEVDTRSDVFSFGVVLYEMITRVHPFKKSRPIDTASSILSENPPPLTDFGNEVAAPLEATLSKMLAKQADQRYQRVQDVRNDLQALLQDLLGVRYLEKAGEGRVRTILRLIQRPRILVPTALTLILLAIAVVWFLKREAGIRWAREEALPEIERLIETSLGDFTEAYKLAEEAEAHIPNDPELLQLFSRCSVELAVQTEPPGSSVYVKKYSAPESEWEHLGMSPIEDVRLPVGVLRWKMEKPGYETVLAAATTFDVDISKQNLLIPSDLVRVLSPEGNTPRGTVRVSATKTPLGELPDFYIDRYEVTNKQYKEFIHRGGYRDQNYWKHEFIKDGRALTWEEAKAAFVDLTGRPGPAKWRAGDYPEGQEDYPVSGISWYEAAAYAEFEGKSLPTETHWGVARGEYTPLIDWPQLGGFAVFAPFSNFQGKGPVPVGSLPGLTGYGTYDMAGNVREWCWNQTPKGRLIRGGAWGDNPYMFGNRSQAPAFDRSPQNGFRCALYPNPEDLPDSVFQAFTFGESRDYYKEEPVADSIYQIYKEQFSYDPTDLNARVEGRDESPKDWIREKVTFDAAYGKERIIAYLFLPRNTAPPYQAVVYAPGSGSLMKGSSKDIESYQEVPFFLSFIMKNGRAALYPVYKGTFERRDEALIPIHGGDESHLFTEFLIQVVKDFRRSIDYLETREDIDSSKLAYYGMSWGGLLGTFITAVEERLLASILLAGGFVKRSLPQVDQINFVTRVKTPTLMLNGRYDTLLGYERSIKPFYDLLGTPAEHKKLKLYDTDHIAPMNEVIKETLAWLDRYLGPVDSQ